MGQVTTQEIINRLVAIEAKSLVLNKEASQLRKALEGGQPTDAFNKTKKNLAASVNERKKERRMRKYLSNK